MMNGYSKIREKGSPKSNPRSMEPSGFPSSKDHEDPKPVTKAQLGELADSKIHGVQEEREEEAKYGVVLSRTCSSASQRFRANSERSHGGIQGVVRRAFSMRKQSSVAEGYWRFHGDGGDDGGDGDDGMSKEEEQVRPSRRKRGRIFRACKRLFRF